MPVGVYANIQTFEIEIDGYYRLIDREQFKNLLDLGFFTLIPQSDSRFQIEVKDALSFISVGGRRTSLSEGRIYWVTTVRGPQRIRENAENRQPLPPLGSLRLIVKDIAYIIPQQSIEQ